MTFTLDSLLALSKLPKQEPKDFFLRPDLHDRFLKDPAIKLDDSTSIMGLKVYLKPDQCCACWMISDPTISKAYANGDINEVELLYLAMSRNKNIGKIA